MTLFWNDKNQPISTQFDDVYFSTDDGLAETQYVFLQPNHLTERFQQLQAHDSFVIAETGFGTGLNFLATCELWSRTANADAQLHFISTEKYPLTQAELSRALDLWPELEEYSRQLISSYPHTINGVHRLQLTQQNISLTLIIDDVCAGLQQLLASQNPRHQAPLWQGVDAWFLDGFTPAKNPEMWTETLFDLIATLSKKEATFATFTAASDVRRKLISAGFVIQKSPGFGLKREMMSGHLDQEKIPSRPTITTDTSPTKNRDNAPWMVVENHQTTPIDKTIGIIGGGIAGCHSAYALAQKGYQVVLFEKANTLATGASGNAQGVIYAKLSASQEPQGDFNLYSLLYAQRFYQAFWDSIPQAEKNYQGNACGVLQMDINQRIQQTHQRIAERFNQHDTFVRHVSADEASRIANIPLSDSALFFPQSGWLQPTALCQWLTSHANIRVVTHIDVNHIERDDNHWRLSGWQTDQERQEWQSELLHTVVIANAYDAVRLAQTQDLPTKTIRGQVTHLPETERSHQLKSVICGKGYIAPAQDYAHTNTADSSTQKGGHCLGASFNLGINSLTLDPQDHQHNLDNISQQAPYLLSGQPVPRPETLSGRASFRCVTPDYLPIVGAVPITAEMEERYRALSKNAYTHIDQAGCYQPNLYINIGHGSRGLAYTPLCSEALACLIHGDPPPLSQPLFNKLNPARFLIRHLIKSHSKA